MNNLLTIDGYFCVRKCLCRFFVERWSHPGPTNLIPEAVVLI